MNGCGRSSHTLHSPAGHLLFPLIVSCLFSITHETFVVFWGVGGVRQAGRGGNGVGVMECGPGAVKSQIDAVVLINARAHPPRLVEA